MGYNRLWDLILHQNVNKNKLLCRTRSTPRNDTHLGTATTKFINDSECPSPQLAMFSNLVVPYDTTTRLVASLASLILVYGIYKIFAFVYDELTSPLRHVPGPPNPSFIYGSFKQLSESVSRTTLVVVASN